MELSCKHFARSIKSFCGLIFMASWSVYGQSGEPLIIPDIAGEGLINPIEELNTELQNEMEASELNRVTVQQIGNMNEVFIQQHSVVNSNLAKVYQDGNEHFSDLIQNGSNNATAIYQYEQGNQYTGIHTGNQILNTIIQQGIGNVIDQHLEANDLDFYIEQFGSGHELYQQLNGEDMDGIGYRVTQKGAVGMKVTIIQDWIYK
jgi:hypothetical protein